VKPTARLSELGDTGAPGCPYSSFDPSAAITAKPLSQLEAKSVMEVCKVPNSAILSGITIVVVEDYSDSHAIAQFLTRHGAKVFPSPDALEGLQTVREHRYLEDCSRLVIQRELETWRGPT
jgi:hypothetical protein